ncbi:hypothetical protein CPC08DRAFT_701857 [Agrocybe pediades]|nr:hypothetical protein CPC08DRAFT_701857 [Agrocybe pediades]
MPLPLGLSVLDLVRQNIAASYVWVAVVTFLWCDTLSNLQTEAKYIWSSKWSLPKSLYLFIRYWSLFVLTVDAAAFGTIQLSLMRCRMFWWFTATLGGGYLFATLVNIILAIRIHAMFNQNIQVKRCLIFLNLAFITAQTYNAIIVGIALSKTAYIAPKVGLPLRGCVNKPLDSSKNMPPWICVMVVTGLYLLLTIAACYQSWVFTRKQQAAAAVRGEEEESRHRFRSSPLMAVLIRDGAAYSVLTTVFTMVGVLFAISKPQLLGIARPIQVGCYAFFGCRLIINVREAAHLDDIRRDSFSMRGLDLGRTVTTVSLNQGSRETPSTTGDLRHIGSSRSVS